VPIPMRRKPASLPASGENSYTGEKRDINLPQRLDKLDTNEEDTESDDEEQSKFGIAWVASDDFEDEERPRGCHSLVMMTDCSEEVPADNHMEGSCT
jgi:hypothetical protein